jgi:hypothetical protein
MGSRCAPKTPDSVDAAQLVLNNNPVTEEAEAIRWFFYALFVQSIVQVINGEEEIWMVESGTHNRLLKWKVEGDTEI